MSKPRTLTLEVPTPESLGLKLNKWGNWSEVTYMRCVTIRHRGESVNLEIQGPQSDYYPYVEPTLVDVDLPSMDHALVALGLILGKVA